MTHKMTNEEYHSLIHLVSSSGLKMLKKDVVEYYDTYEEPDEAKRRTFKETKPMETGSILHDVILERKPLQSVVGVYPDHDPDLAELQTITYSGKVKREQFTKAKLKRFAKLCGVTYDELMEAGSAAELNAIKEKAPKNVLSSSGGITRAAADEHAKANPEYKYWTKRIHDSMNPNGGTVAGYETLKKAVIAVRSSKYYSILESEHVRREVGIIWIDEETGLHCRAKPDFILIHPDGKFANVWDVKITEFACNFEKQMNSLNYHLQDQHYTNGVKAVYGVEQVRYGFLCLKPTYPFHVTEWEFDERDRPSIEDDYRNTMADLKRRKETQDWSQPETAETQRARLWEKTVK
jgi:hypothetical protein